MLQVRPADKSDINLAIEFPSGVGAASNNKFFLLFYLHVSWSSAGAASDIYAWYLKLFFPSVKQDQSNSIFLHLEVHADNPELKHAPAREQFLRIQDSKIW